MAIRTQTWRPDTCGCVVEQSWDDSLPDDQIVLTTTSIIKCPIHIGLGTDQNVSDVILDENPRKNNALQEILNNGPSSLYDLSGTARILKQNVEYNFSWSGTAPNRVLTISFTGITLTNAQKTSIQTFLNNKFGINKVTII